MRRNKAPRARQDRNAADRHCAELFAGAQEAHQGGKPVEAERLYRRILELQPRHADALHFLGVLKLQDNRLAEAILLISRALELAPENPRAHCNIASALQRSGKLEEALAHLDQALRNRPDLPEALFNRANTLRIMGRYEEALRSYLRVVDIDPGFAAGHNNRGICLVQMKRLEESVAAFDRALKIRPDYADALSNRANALFQLKRYAQSLDDCDRAIALDPDAAVAHNNRGNALQKLCRFEDALDSYNRAIALKPDYAGAYGNRGNIHQYLRRFHEALADFRRAQAVDPDHAQAHWNEALCLLMMGDFENGWKKYEWRWKRGGSTALQRRFSQPLWLGDHDLRGKRILLHAEQGLGDTVQFCRYAGLLAALGGEVILEVQASLVPLLARLEGAAKVIAMGGKLPEFDFHCPLLSLPLAMKTMPESIPANIPYLHADAGKVAAWQQRLGEKSRPRVGLVWSGNPGFRMDYLRSMRLLQIAPLLDLPCEWVSLKNELSGEDAESIRTLPGLRHFGAELRDFSDTAALIQCMDLVLSTCTSVPHVAGAMGRPVWLMLSRVADPRWLVERNDTAWYPSMRLFRQPDVDDWEGLLQQVRGELSAYIAR